MRNLRVIKWVAPHLRGLRRFSGLPAPSNAALPRCAGETFACLHGSTKPDLAARGRHLRRFVSEPPGTHHPDLDRTLRPQRRAPAPTCPRPSRETLRWWKREPSYGKVSRRE